MLNMQQISKQVAESEPSQEEVQLTELVPMKRSRIKENVLKDVDATDGLKALRSISSDCNEKNENFDLPGLNVCQDVEQQSEYQSGKHRREQKVRRRRKSVSTNDFEDADSGDEDENDDEVTGKEMKKSRINKRKLRVRKDTMVAKKKPTKSSKETNNRKKRNNGSRKKRSSQLEAAFSDDGFTLEDEKLYCNLDEVYVYQEPMDPPSNSASEKSEPINQDTQVSCDTDSTTDCQNDSSAVGEECELDVNEKVKNSENELEPKNNIKKNYLLENNNFLGSGKGGRRRMTSEEICAAAAKPSKPRKKRSETDRELSDGITKNQRPHLQNWQKKYSCVVCFARFKGSGGLRNHYKVLHSSGPVYKCDQCGKEFPLKERLKLHVRTHTGFKPYKCPDCNKSFARGGQLVQHRRTHTHDKPFRCNLCSTSFTCAANLSLHMKRHRGQKDHKCDLCGRAFVRRDALKKHLECLHRDIKSFVCVICNKTFKGHLPQHMRTHARDRPHGCATCGQRFAQKSQLTVHQRTHNGQRPFRCVVCWQAFAHSTALKLHTRRHTGERPFKCNECNAGFTQLPHWKKHMRCIHGRTDPYGCTWCRSFFRIKSELETHIENCHPEMDEDDSDSDFSDDGDSVSGSIAIDDSLPGTSASAVEQLQQVVEKQSVTAKHKLMTVEKMRLLLVVLLQRISKQEKLEELGFGKRLIDDVLEDSLVSAGKVPVKSVENGLSELEALTRNLEILLEWTMPKEHWETFRKLNKTPEDILEALTNAEYNFE